MKTLKVIPSKEENIAELIKLLNNSGLVEKVETSEDDASGKQTFRKLTPHDMAFGIGRPATDEELIEYLTRPIEGNPKPLEVAIEDIKRAYKARKVE